MKVKIPKELRALAMLVMSLIFASAVFEHGPILVGGMFLVLLICGVYVHYSVIQKGDYADYDVIG